MGFHVAFPGKSHILKRHRFKAAAVAFQSMGTRLELLRARGKKRGVSWYTGCTNKNASQFDLMYIVQATAGKDAGRMGVGIPQPCDRQCCVQHSEHRHGAYGRCPSDVKKAFSEANALQNLRTCCLKRWHHAHSRTSSGPALAEFLCHGTQPTVTCGPYPFTVDLYECHGMACMPRCGAVISD